MEEQKIRAAQTFARTDGDILRYIVPLHNDNGDLVGGLDLETPMTAVNTSVKAFVWKTAWFTILLTLVIGVIVTVLITLVLFSFVVKPINLLNTDLEALSKGEADLTFQLQV